MQSVLSFRPLILPMALSFGVASHVTAAPSDAHRSTLPRESIVSADPISQAVSEASRRFGVPEPWIRAVMRVESDGVVRAVSSAGAIGLMQVMPQTYAELRWRYGLGGDPYAIRDNVLAGTAYIRELADRYGAPAFLAAYNAGPARYEDAAEGVRPLPSETLDYLARLGPVVTSSAASWVQPRRFVVARSPLEAPLFVAPESTAKPIDARTFGTLSLDRLQRIVEANTTIATAPGAVRESVENRLAASSVGLASLFPSRPGLKP